MKGFNIHYSSWPLVEVCVCVIVCVCVKEVGVMWEGLGWGEGGGRKERVATTCNS